MGACTGLIKSVLKHIFRLWTDVRFVESHARWRLQAKPLEIIALTNLLAELPQILLSFSKVQTWSLTAQVVTAGRSPPPAFLAQHQARWALQRLSPSLFQSKVTSRHWEQQIFHLLRFVVSEKEWGALSGWGAGIAQGVNLGWHSWIQRKPSIQGPPALGWEKKLGLLPKLWGTVCGPGALESSRGWCCLWCFSWTSLRTSPRSSTSGKHVPNTWNRSGLLTHQGLGMGLSWGCRVWRRSGKGCPTQTMKLFSCQSC